MHVQSAILSLTIISNMADEHSTRKRILLDDFEPTYKQFVHLSRTVGLARREDMRIDLYIYSSLKSFDRHVDTGR
jgi:hypothetical protein